MRKIEIWNDKNGMNPFVDCDGQPGVMFNSDDHGITYYYNDILNHILSEATEGKLIRHQKALIEALSLSYFYPDDTRDDKIDYLTDEIADASIEELSKVCEILKIPHLQYTSRGYSQGDWADVLIVLTDYFYNTSGAKRGKKNAEKILESTQDLFDSWMWGDVYGFSIIEVTKCECCGHNDEEVVDSCGGFFGTDFETNGMLDHIPEDMRDQLLSFDLSDIKYD